MYNELNCLYLLLPSYIYREALCSSPSPNFRLKMSYIYKLLYSRSSNEEIQINKYIASDRFTSIFDKRTTLMSHLTHSVLDKSHVIHLWRLNMNLSLSGYVQWYHLFVRSWTQNSRIMAQDGTKYSKNYSTRLALPSDEERWPTAA